jgi:hypothetical protein
MSFSTASKLAALGEFAAPALWWGRRPLYTREDLRAWAEARSRRDRGALEPRAPSRRLKSKVGAENDERS